MDTTDFKNPETVDSIGLLSQVFGNASEKEHALCYILTQCIKAEAFIPIKTVYDHNAMVNDGLLEEVAAQTYQLTTKAIGILYSYYGTKRCSGAEKPAR